MAREHPKTVGERSEACLLAAILRAGKVVLRPFGDNQRYDMVLDEGGRFIRVQCKTGRLVNGAIRFAPCSRAGGLNKRRTYEGEVDAFGVFCPDNGKSYIIPIDVVGSRSSVVSLRLDPPKNKNTVTRWAALFELPDHAVAGIKALWSEGAAR